MTCPTCEGQGRILVEEDGEFKDVVICPECGGGKTMISVIWSENDELDAAIIQNIRDGFMCINGIRKNGEAMFGLTPKGIGRVEEMLSASQKQKIKA